AASTGTRRLGPSALQGSVQGLTGFMDLFGTDKRHELVSPKRLFHGDVQEHTLAGGDAAGQSRITRPNTGDHARGIAEEDVEMARLIAAECDLSLFATDVSGVVAIEHDRGLRLRRHDGGG